MLPTASATLITNLTASLADADHRWVVKRVEEKRTQGFDTTKQVGDDIYTIEAQSVAIWRFTNQTVGAVIETTISLVATKVRRTAGEPAMLELEYLSVWISAAFSYGELRFNDGAAYRHTNATLDTAIRTMALALMTARATPLEDNIEDGDAAADPIAMPGAMLTALLASLDDLTHGWKAMSSTRTVFNGVATWVVQLRADDGLKAKVGGVAPMGFTYRAELNAVGTIIDAICYFGSAAYRTFSTDLFDAVTAFAATVEGDSSDNLTESLELGPVED